jgi:pimeloyl-ACP methyl ester carboxylesterase
VKAGKVLILGAVAAGVAAAAVGAYRATHPADARGPVSSEPGRRRRRLDGSLFDLPDDVVHHHLPTPDGGTIHAVERGQGRPLVLLHGITLRHDVWAPQFHQLSDRYRLVAVDLRGHGASVAGEDGFGIGRLADDLATLLDGLDLRDAVVIGHSMGGMTAMQFCGQHPEVLAERVSGLVFVATRAHQVLPPLLDAGARALVARGEQVLAASGDIPGRGVVNTRVVRLAFGDDPHPRAVQAVAEMGQSMVPDALVPSLAGLIEHDARVALRATHTPSLVIVGTRDVLTPVPAGRHLAHLLPNSELVVLPRTGHQIMQERPIELAELIDAFVARIEGTEPTVSAAVADAHGEVRPEQVEVIEER